MCGCDLNDAKRTRDSAGRYWCEPCGKLEVRDRHASNVKVCPDCGATGALLVRHDDLHVCGVCATIRKQETIEAEWRRRQKGFHPERPLRRMIRILQIAAGLFAILMALRYTWMRLRWDGRFDDVANVIALILPLVGIGMLWLTILVKRKIRLIEYDALLVKVEHGIVALAERHHQSQTVVERTDGMRQQVRRAIRRIEAAAGRGVEKAEKLIENFNRRHETAAMVTFLSAQRPRAHDLVVRNREIETLAYLGEDYETATRAINAVLLRIPDELDGLTRQAMILCAVGSLDQAKRIFTRIINLAKRAEDKLAVADGYANLGLVHQLLTEIDDAHKHHNKALFMYQKLPGNEDREADCYGNIGFIHHKRGEKENAEFVFRKALGINAKLKRIEGMALDYGVLGLMVYNKEEGQLAESEQMLRSAVKLNTRIGRFGAVAAAYGNLGLVKAKKQDFARARKMLLNALNIYQRMNRHQMANKVQGMLAQLAKSAGPA